MRRKKFLSIALTLALVFTIVTAGTESIFAAEQPPAAGEAVVKALAATTEEENTITAVNKNKAEADLYYVEGYTTGPNMKYIKVNMPAAGTLMIEVMSRYDTGVYIYSADEEGNLAEGVASGAVYAAQYEGDYWTVSAEVDKAGTYYVLFASDYSDSISYLRAYYAPNQTGSYVTPVNKKTYYASAASGKTRYFRVKTTGTRLLTIEFPYGSAGTDSVYKVKLLNYNKSKNLFKSAVTINQDKDYITYAGLPKGTYYVAVTTATDSWYGIRLTTASVSENSGSTRSKAKSIPKGSTRKGIITATQSSSSGDWYKIKVNSYQKVYLEVTTKTGGYSGGIRISVYSGNRTKAFGSADFYPGAPTDVLNVFTGSPGSSLAPGTYYIKVQKYGSGSGYYTIKWQ